jgi:hypothetical protein
VIEARTPWMRCSISSVLGRGDLEVGDPVVSGGGRRPRASGEDGSIGASSREAQPDPRRPGRRPGRTETRGRVGGGGVLGD